MISFFIVHLYTVSSFFARPGSIEIVWRGMLCLLNQTYSNALNVIFFMRENRGDDGPKAVKCMR